MQLITNDKLINAKAMRILRFACFVALACVMFCSVFFVNGVLIVKNIEDIKVGDIVASRNEISGAIEYKPVLSTETSAHSVVVKVGQSDGQVITSSLTHPYYVVGKGYVDAQNLRAGDMLLTVGGKGVIVEFVQHELLENPQNLYNFEVADNNNYFVAEDSEVGLFSFVLVHNVCKSYSVYWAKDINTGKNYVGITKQGVTKRLAQHKFNGAEKILLDKVDDLTYSQARALEQSVINNQGLSSLANKINSIAPKNQTGAVKSLIEEMFEKFGGVFK